MTYRWSETPPTELRIHEKVLASFLGLAIAGALLALWIDKHL